MCLFGQSEVSFRGDILGRVRYKEYRVKCVLWQVIRGASFVSHSPESPRPKPTERLLVPPIKLNKIEYNIVYTSTLQCLKGSKQMVRISNTSPRKRWRFWYYSLLPCALNHMREWISDAINIKDRKPSIRWREYISQSIKLTLTLYLVKQVLGFKGKWIGTEKKWMDSMKDIIFEQQNDRRTGVDGKR